MKCSTMHNEEKAMKRVHLLYTFFSGFRNELEKMGLEVIQEAMETQSASVT